MLYIVIDDKKHYLDSITVKKYKLNAGMYMHLTGYKILEDDKKEEVNNKEYQETYTVQQ